MDGVLYNKSIALTECDEHLLRALVVNSYDNLTPEARLVADLLIVRINAGLAVPVRYHAAYLDADIDPGSFVGSDVVEGMSMQRAIRQVGGGLPSTEVLSDTDSNTAGGY